MILLACNAWVQARGAGQHSRHLQTPVLRVSEVPKFSRCLTIVLSFEDTGAVRGVARPVISFCAQVTTADRLPSESAVTDGTRGVGDRDCRKSDVFLDLPSRLEVPDVLGACRLPGMRLGFEVVKLVDSKLEEFSCEAIEPRRLRGSSNDGERVCLDMLACSHGVNGVSSGFCALDL